MLDHVSLTVADFRVAETFYDAVMAALGIIKVGSDEIEGSIGYGARCDADHPDRSYLSLRRGAVPDAASGRHLCFKAPSRAAVDAFWQTGLTHGGRDEGAPGLRPAYHPDYYTAFLADPSGNRIEAVCHSKKGRGEGALVLQPSFG